jgi:hypothetical protein
MPRQPNHLSSTAQRVADVAAVVPGRVLQGVFGAVGLLRPAAKPLHPSGRLLRLHVRRFGLAGTDRIGVPWIDDAGDSTGVARLSRATGLPDVLPDIHGLALRIHDHTADGEDADILLATTGLGPLSRFVLRPTRSATGSPYTTFLPYRTPSGPLLLAVTPDPVDPSRRFVSFASPRGAWRVFAELRIDQPGDAGEAPTGDESISFDPVLHQVDGLAQYPWVTRLREGAYQAARWTRGDPADG